MASRRDPVNERSQFQIPMTHLDENGVATMPESVRYRIDDLTTAPAAILAWTEIVDAEATNVITITSEQNRILDDENDIETRQALIEITSVGGGIRFDDYKWKVRNLHGVL